MKKTLIPLVAIALMTGCGGSGSGSGSEIETNINNNGEVKPETKPEIEAGKTFSINGRAADGYLKGALVCLDLNHNANCDSDEPSSITETGGKFDLSIPLEYQKDLSSYRVVVKTIPNLTVDEDNNEKISSSYTLRSVFSEDSDLFVSPISTMIARHVDDGVDLHEAKALVQRDFNLSADLTKDYVANSLDGTDLDYLKVYRLAQIMAHAQIMANLNLLQTLKEQQAIYDVLINNSKKIAELAQQSIRVENFNPTDAVKEINLDELIKRPISDDFIVLDYAPFQQTDSEYYGQRLNHTVFKQVERTYKSHLNAGEAPWDFESVTTKLSYEDYVMDAERNRQTGDVKIYTVAKKGYGDDFSIKGTYEYFDGDKFVKVEQDNAPKGVVTARQYNDNGKEGVIFDGVSVSTTFLSMKAGEEIKIADTLNSLFPNQIDDSVLNSEKVRNSTTWVGSNHFYYGKVTNYQTDFALVKEELLEDLYLTWFNEEDCAESVVLACNKIGTEAYSPSSLNELIKATAESHVSMSIPATINDVDGFGATILEDGVVEIKNDIGETKSVGSWELISAPFNHIEIKLPSNTKLVNGDTGLVGGLTMLFERDGGVYSGNKFKKGMTAGEMVGKEKYVPRFNKQYGDKFLATWEEISRSLRTPYNYENGSVSF